MYKALTEEDVRIECENNQGGGSLFGNRTIWRVKDLDMADLDIEEEGLKGAKYAVFIEQYYNTVPVPSHWLPVPNEYNYIVESYDVF